MSSVAGCIELTHFPSKAGSQVTANGDLAAASSSGGQLQPTRVFFILPHSSFTQVIKIIDLTDKISEAYDTEAFKAKAKGLVKKSPPEPYLTATRTSWHSSRLLVRQPPAYKVIAEWKASTWSTGATHLEFPTDSPHSSHPITMKLLSMWKWNESFVVDSVTYTWEVKNWAGNRYVLWKDLGFGQGGKEVGNYLHAYMFDDGGILALDTNEVDEVVAAVTALSMMKKRRQRQREYMR